MTIKDTQEIFSSFVFALILHNSSYIMVLESYIIKLADVPFIYKDLFIIFICVHVRVPM